MKTIYKRTKKGNIEFVQVQYIPETPEEAEQLEREEEEAKREEKLYWCHCEKEYDTYYVPDGEDPRCPKHHYRCAHCHKITQIG